MEMYDCFLGECFVMVNCATYFIRVLPAVEFTGTMDEFVGNAVPIVLEAKSCFDKKASVNIQIYYCSSYLLSGRCRCLHSNSTMNGHFYTCLVLYNFFRASCCRQSASALWHDFKYSKALLWYIVETIFSCLNSLLSYENGLAWCKSSRYRTNRLPCSVSESDAYSSSTVRMNRSLIPYWAFGCWQMWIPRWNWDVNDRYGLSPRRCVCFDRQSFYNLVEVWMIL